MAPPATPFRRPWQQPLVLINFVCFIADVLSTSLKTIFKANEYTTRAL